MRSLIELAPDVWQVPLLPLNGLNAYLVGDVLVDAGLPSSQDRLLEAVAGRDLATHVLTHAHPDHQGATAAICRTLEIPLWCGERDRKAAESAAYSAARRGIRRRLFPAAE